MDSSGKRNLLGAGVQTSAFPRYSADRPSRQAGQACARWRTASGGGGLDATGSRNEKTHPQAGRHTLNSVASLRAAMA